MSTTTCGLCMNENVARKLADSGIDVVAFSLLATDAASNALRHRMDIDGVCEAIALLQGARRAAGAVTPKVHLAHLMLASDMQAARRVPGLAHRLGVHTVVVSTPGTIIEPGFGTEAFMPQEVEKLATAAAELGEAGAEARRLNVDFHWSLRQSGLAAQHGVVDEMEPMGWAGDFKEITGELQIRNVGTFREFN
ncbi:MAG: hypothetical protein IPG25_19415 [Proteobacteria bacterium]|nr:hypothetical protein [Pseudomonadota bacterium]